MIASHKRKNYLTRRILAEVSAQNLVYKMPLLKGRFTIPLKVLSEADGYANNYYVIDHTGEKFSSKKYPY